MIDFNGGVTKYGKKCGGKNLDYDDDDCKIDDDVNDDDDIDNISCTLPEVRNAKRQYDGTLGDHGRNPPPLPQLHNDNNSDMKQRCALQNGFPQTLSWREVL